MRDKLHIGKVLLLIFIKRAQLIPLKFQLSASDDYCVSYLSFIDNSSMSVALKYIDTCIGSVRYLYILMPNKEAVGPTVIAFELVWMEVLQL